MKYTPPALSPVTACQFTVPAGINYERFRKLIKLLKKTVPTRFRGAKGRTLYFDFPDSGERDLFLLELETMLAKNGTESARNLR